MKILGAMNEGVFLIIDVERKLMLPGSLGK